MKQISSCTNVEIGSEGAENLPYFTFENLSLSIESGGWPLHIAGQNIANSDLD